jgi:hypothetical protein
MTHGILFSLSILLFTQTALFPMLDFIKMPSAQELTEAFERLGFDDFVKNSDLISRLADKRIGRGGAGLPLEYALFDYKDHLIKESKYYAFYYDFIVEKGRPFLYGKLVNYDHETLEKFKEAGALAFTVGSYDPMSEKVDLPNKEELIKIFDTFGLDIPQKQSVVEQLLAKERTPFAVCLLVEKAFADYYKSTEKQLEKNKTMMSALQTVQPDLIKSLLSNHQEAITRLEQFGIIAKSYKK